MARKRCKPQVKVDNAFFNAWHMLAAEGACDAWGGMECQRVYSEWLAAGSPKPVGQFIRARTNVGSGSAPPPGPDRTEEQPRG